MTNLETFIPDQIWLKSYPVHYSGCNFDARMTIVRLDKKNLAIHSPCIIDQEVKEEIEALGKVTCIIAPGSFHYFHISSAQAAFPKADTFICPGIEDKCPEIKFRELLSDHPLLPWIGIMDQVHIRGNRFISELAFFHKPSKTLILVDIIENITDKTPNINWGMKLWWKLIFHMWNTPKPAPEYQFGWKDKKAAKDSLLKVLEWDFEQVIVAHGDHILSNAKEVVRKAWKVPLR